MPRGGGVTDICFMSIHGGVESSNGIQPRTCLTCIRRKILAGNPKGCLSNNNRGPQSVYIFLYPHILSPAQASL